MHFVYKNNVLKYFDEDVEDCYKWLLEKQQYSYDIAKKMGWLILDQPIGELSEVLEVIQEKKRQLDKMGVCKKQTQIELKYHYIKMNHLEKQFLIYKGLEGYIII